MANLVNRFPSFQQLMTGSAHAFRRFPMALLCAIIGAGAAISLIEEPGIETKQFLVRLLLTFALGLPLYIALTLFLEKRRWRGKTALGFQGLGLLLLAAYYFSMPQDVMHQGAGLIRFLLLGLGLHFLVACLPYLGGNQTRGFWQYNMALFYRFLLSAIYSSVLFIGLAIALAAADHLFGLEVVGQRYGQLFVIMAGIFNTWVFLAGVPRDLEALDQSTAYPKGLAAFAQYILLPLVALYFVILIAYEAKIIITWNWPKGWVSELVLWFAVVGILSLVILYPLRQQEEKRWVRTFINWYFRVLIPLVAMLFLAILRRISDYGFTEPRYLVLLMAICLAIAVIYFFISKARDIRVIPITLCAASLVAAYGPVSASAISLRSQQNRLEKLLVQNGLPQKNSHEDAGLSLTLEDRREMSSIIDYVCEWHGPKPFSKWLGEEAIDSLVADTETSWQTGIAMEFGFDYTPQHNRPGSTSSFVLSGETANSPQKSFVVTGYDHLFRFHLANNNGFTNAFLLETDSCYISLDTAQLALRVYMGNERSDNAGAVQLQLAGELEPLIDKYDGETTPMSESTFMLSGSSYEARLTLENIRGERESDSLRVNVFDGYMLLRQSRSDQ